MEKGKNTHNKAKKCVRVCACVCVFENTMLKINAGIVQTCYPKLETKILH